MVKVIVSVIVSIVIVIEKEGGILIGTGRTVVMIVIVQQW